MHDSNNNIRERTIGLIEALKVILPTNDAQSLTPIQTAFGFSRPNLLVDDLVKFGFMERKEADGAVRHRFVHGGGADKIFDELIVCRRKAAEPPNPVMQALDTFKGETAAAYAGLLDRVNAISVALKSHMDAGPGPDQASKPAEALLGMVTQELDGFKTVQQEFRSRLEALEGNMGAVMRQIIREPAPAPQVDLDPPLPPEAAPPPAAKKVWQVAVCGPHARDWRHIQPLLKGESCMFELYEKEDARLGVIPSKYTYIFIYATPRQLEQAFKAVYGSRAVTLAAQNPASVARAINEFLADRRAGK